MEGTKYMEDESSANPDLIDSDVEEEKHDFDKNQSLMLAKNWDPVANDPKGWFMSEKLDGVRCFWDGRNMYTRNGNLFYPPDWFKELLPKNLALDGELWTGRDDF